MKLLKNTKLLICVIVVMSCVCLLLLGNWMQAKNDHSDLEQLCRYSADRASDRFRDYQHDGSIYDYRYGVSELVSFYNTYMNLVTAQNGTTDPNCIFLNQLIGKLMDMPELTHEQAGELVSAMSLLSENIYDANAYHSVCNVYNELVHEKQH